MSSSSSHLDTKSTDVKPHLNLRVIGQSGNEIAFKMRGSTPLRKLMSAYCERHSINEKAVRFLFDGMRIEEKQTPEDLDMQDGDVIDVVLQQTGGC